MNSIKEPNYFSIKNLLIFLIPSLLGIFLFMVPLEDAEGSITLPVAYMANLLSDILGDAMPVIILAVLLISVVMTIFVTITKPKTFLENAFLKRLFIVGPFWLVIRVLGAVFGVMTYFQLGPEAVWGEVTGQIVYADLLPVLFAVFLFAGLLLPLLLNFGLLELCGALLNKLMRPLFRLPGRSSVDCLASWMGDGTVGVLLSSQQYEQGHYTKREAAIVSTTFSVVSITFTIVILSYVELEHMFWPYYLTIFVAGLVAAIVTPRIPPLSRKADTFIDGSPSKEEVHPKGTNLIALGFNRAMGVAEHTAKPTAHIKNGLQNVLDMWLGVMPVVMAVGTLALIVAELTPVFTWLGAPFVPVLQLMQVPEAAAAGQTIVIGFADMLLPALLAGGIESEMTRFIIACLSVTQLIYLSETGGLLLASKLPVNFLDLVLIFLIRTIITLPVIVLMAHIFF
ncbi:YjiH family protein [Alkalicoccobacillus murimartini]|uniref:Nucleoside recognition membrane protein YjiH n=1 Tax=Alkalicoccobacillus murimartini TaxID=171685 RepID=A0ABT9YJB5_9BACI|nr:YjiH family protein [Alkalicoccobacillus murimartini]MDQ0207119.1 nucleoside recognition membrane protein YjiH [Alkalicoccobacillus murimartini]